MLKELMSKFTRISYLTSFLNHLENMIDMLPEDKNNLIDEVCEHLQSLKSNK